MRLKLRTVLLSCVFVPSVLAQASETPLTLEETYRHPLEDLFPIGEGALDDEIEDLAASGDVIHLDRDEIEDFYVGQENLDKLFTDRLRGICSQARKSCSAASLKT